MDIEKIAKKFGLYFDNGENSIAIDLEYLQAYTNEIIEMCALKAEESRRKNLFTASEIRKLKG